MPNGYFGSLTPIQKLNVYFIFVNINRIEPDHYKFENLYFLFPSVTFKQLLFFFLFLLNHCLSYLLHPYF